VSTLVRHLKGHLFLYDAAPMPAYGSAAGIRLLLIFLLVEGVIGPRFMLFNLLRLPQPPALVRVVVLIALTLFLVRRFARLSLRSIGLRPWREWSVTERSYFVQTLVIANVVFGLVYAGRVLALIGHPNRWGTGLFVLLLSLLWGFHQELMYRGILQTELVRRWGPVPGVLVANLVFTFGPLHFYHFQRHAPLPMFAAIFAIGLLFAIIFRRSGNLAIVGILHGLGDWYIDGLGSFTI